MASTPSAASNSVSIEVTRNLARKLEAVAERRGLNLNQLAERALAAYARAPWSDKTPEGMAHMVREMHRLGFNGRQIGVATGMSQEEARATVRRLSLTVQTRGPGRLDMELTDYLKGNPIR